MLQKHYLLRETQLVSPNNVFNSQFTPYKVLNISIDLGKTLQDVKFADCSGGFVYQNAYDLTGTKVRNRCIYWRSSQCSLELIEESLDTQLRSNRVKLVFSDTPVLDVQFAEVGSDVFLLVCTTGGLVRFLLHHPEQLKESACAYSVLHSVNSASYQVCHLRAAPFRSQIRCAATWLNCHDCSALFAYSLSGGEIQVLHMPAQQGQRQEQCSVAAPALELRQNTLFDRLLGGWISSGRSGDSGLSSDAVTSMRFWCDPASPGDTVCLLSVSRDHKLRVWDAAHRGECLSAIDLLQQLQDGDTQASALQNKGHQLRVCGGREPIVCVYLNFTERTYFLLLRRDACASGSQRLQLAPYHRLPSESHNLLDFVADQQQLWALFIDDEGGSHEMYGYDIQDAEAGEQPTRCHLLEADACQLLPEDHNSLIARVFAGNSFALASIQRSLRLFLDENSLQQYVDQLDSEEAGASLEFLKALLIDSVESLVQEEAADEGQEDEEQVLNSLRSRQLESFYGKLMQLHAMDSAACGLFCDSRSGLVCLVRRQFLSFLRPADTAERCQLLAGPDSLCVDALSDLPSLEDPQGVRDLISVVRACQRLAASLQPGSVDYFVAEAAEIAASGVQGHDDYGRLLASFRHHYMGLQEVQVVCQGLAKTLAGVYEPVSALSSLLSVLESLDFLDDIELELVEQAACEASVGGADEQLLASWASAELLANSVCQAVDSRLRLCAACLLLLAELPNSFGLVEHLRTRACDLLRSLSLLHWAGQQVYTPAPPRLLETVRSQLQLLLARPSELVRHDALAGIGADCPMLQAWYACSAGRQLRRPLRARLLDEDLVDVAFGRDLLPAACSLLHHMLSPERGGFSFPLFLMWSGQLDQLVAYTSMCRHWVRSDPAYLYALRGLALLNLPTLMLSAQSEAETRAEAVGCLVHAVKCSVESLQPAGCFETFFRAVGADEAEAAADPQTARARLFLHLVRVLELLHCSPQIVSLAQTALTHASGCKKFEIPLLSTVFKHELEQAKFQSAFDAMMSLEEPSIQMDCLRHLVVTLFDRGQMQTLLEFKFGQLAESFVSVVEKRARAVDAGMHLYYNLLYCYHSGCRDYRRAALAMHELSVRLSRDTGFEATQRQARALLTAVGSLRMLKPRHQWVVVPEDYLDDSADAIGKHQPRQIRVLTLSDLEQRYRLLSSQLQLSLRQPPSAGASLRGVDEVVADLLTAGQYYEAKCLLLQRRRPPTPLLEALATAAVTACGYVSTSQEGLGAIKEALEEEGQSAEGSSPADCLWALLQVYIRRYDTPGAPGLNAVAQRLQLLDFPAPTWLVDLHRERDPPGLLRLYILHDRVEEAHELCVRLLESARASALGGQRPPLCLPFTHILQVDWGLRQLSRGSGPACQRAELLHRRLARSLQQYQAACDQLAV